MIRRPPRSTQSRSSAASDVYKRQPAHVMVLHHAVALREPHAAHLALERSERLAVVGTEEQQVGVVLAGGPLGEAQAADREQVGGEGRRGELARLAVEPQGALAAPGGIVHALDEIPADATPVLARAHPG